MNKDSKATPSLGRRGFLGACMGASASLILPASAQAKGYHSGERKLSFYNTHTGEKLTSTYWADGFYLVDSVKDISWILRDFRTNEQYAMDMKLLDLLHELQCKVDCKRPFHIISGYRSLKTNHMLRDKTNGVARRSLHMQGKAIDVRIPGFDSAKLHKAALSLKSGGVGYYPKSNFVHVDTGRVRTW